jgi:excinuclease ABC subunit B
MSQKLFKLKSSFKLAGDQKPAVDQLVQGINAGEKNQTLLGVTGSGKTFTMANVIAKTQKPTLIISHNKTLAAQLYQEFKEFFPENAVHYFVSYYDYYQPEAYIPQSDTYIEKDAKINSILDQLRHASTQDLLTRQDVIIVASVSCIYNIGSPQEYQKMGFKIFTGQKISRHDLLEKMVSLQYIRNDIDFIPGSFRSRGQLIEIFTPSAQKFLRIELSGDKIKNIEESSGNFNILRKSAWKKIKDSFIFPAKYWVAPEEKIDLAISNIKNELKERLAYFKKEKKLVEMQRLKEKTLMDLALLKETGYCFGIENYSAQLEFRPKGAPPYTLLDFFNFSFKNNFLCFIDESHMAIPQIRGMFAGDQARKQTLINYGFRLPSALDNRPLNFDEFSKRVSQTIYVSATPAEYEINLSGKNITEQLVRPTGLLDPEIEVRPTKDQINDVLSEIQQRAAKKERVLITAITKRLSEDLADFLKEKGVKVEYLHSEIKTLERSDILKNLREGKFDVLVGVNLLREGLDLPEVSLIIILDADKEGFLRSSTSLIQTIGRASRNINGKVIMYADNITHSMQEAISETKRRRKIQTEFNKKHHITPKQIIKKIRPNIVENKKEETGNLEETLAIFSGDPKLPQIIKNLTAKMKAAARDLEFEEAAKIRDTLKELKKKI